MCVIQRGCAQKKDRLQCGTPHTVNASFSFITKRVCVTRPTPTLSSPNVQRRLAPEELIGRGDKQAGRLRVQHGVVARVADLPDEEHLGVILVCVCGWMWVWRRCGGCSAVRPPLHRVEELALAQQHDHRTYLAALHLLHARVHLHLRAHRDGLAVVCRLCLVGWRVWRSVESVVGTL